MSLLDEQRNKHGYYDGWESLPEERRQIIIAKTLKEYIEYSRSASAFYGDRLGGFDPNATHPLKSVPVLESSDLRGLLPPQSSILVAGGAKDYTVFQSGGTTGIPKTTLFSHHELEQLNLPNARGFFALGLNANDRVGNLFAVGGLYMTFIHINRMLQQYGCMNFPFSNHTPADFIHTVVKLFNVNVMTGIASVVLNAMRGMHQIGLDGIRIEKVFYGGEHLYEADKKELHEKFGVSLIAAPGYGTVDTWYIGYQCIKCPTGVFHAHDDQAYLEIVDEEVNRHCDAGEVGMLYATAFPRRLTPVVRYRVGDRAKWLKDQCSCGRTTPLFQLLGRGDDVLRVGYDSIDYNAVQETVLQISGLLGSIQMEKRRVEGRDQLILRVETDLSVGERPAAAEALAHLFVESRPSFRDFIKKGTVWPLKVELLDPSTLPRNPRTGKLIRVIDSM